MREQVALTIGMPVFNDKDFIAQTLESVLRQTYNDFILIISDDCSTDGSGEICKAFARNDSRIKYIRQKTNLGISRNMQFLLSLCKTEFFMWAGDDDLYAPDFVKELIIGLNSKPEMVSSFCPCILIDEEGNRISDVISWDYENPNKLNRLIYYIRNSTDYFGYGIFRTGAIKDVEFPIWWWPNKNTPYNNIYPTLCYYLLKGDFVLSKGNPLFFKRIKTPQNTNHIITGEKNAIKESLAFWLRKFNLVIFTLKLTIKGAGHLIALKISFSLILHWFLKPSYHQFILASNAFLKNRLFTNN